MGWQERRAIIAQIEEMRGSRVICYITSDRAGADAQINKDSLPFFHDHLSQIGPRERIDLVLHTSGGDTLAAYGICQLLREFCKRLGVLVPFRCHSAGTLIALGADEIVMTRGGTLSPIDPSLKGPLNPAVELAPGQRQLVALSVESVAGFMQLVKKDWGIKGPALCDAFRMLAEKVHPLALGDVYRARQQIELLAGTLLKAHRSDKAKIADIVSTLARDLGSHDFPITRSNARRILGAQVLRDDVPLEKLVWALFEDYSKDMQLREPFDPTIAALANEAGKPAKVTQCLAVLETSAARDVAERELVLMQIGTPMGPAVQQQVVRANWQHYT
jgi:Serine dehydrogenase proteinase